MTECRLPRALLVALMLSVVGMLPAQAQDEIAYRGLAAGDFRGAVPPEADRQVGDITIQAQAAAGISSTYGFGTGPDGRITVDQADHASYFDRTAAWFNTAGRTAEQQAETLRHEQAHFDIAEGFAQALNAERATIRREMEANLNGDPALRDRFNQLGRDIANREQRITDARTELNNTTTPPTPARRTELQNQIRDLTTERDALNDQQTAMAEAASPTLSRLKAEHDRQQTAYDDETGHGTNAARQAEWEARARRNLTGWRADPPQAGSQAANSVYFDATALSLRIVDDIIVDVDGALGDPVIGAELLLPTYTLTGRTVFGAPIFSSADGSVRLTQGADTLLQGRIRTLFYLADRNRFFGMMNDDVLNGLPGFSSPFLEQSIAALSAPGGGLLTLDIFPSVDFGALTEDFTRSGSAPATNGFGKSHHVPEPATATLLAIGLLATVLGRRQRSGC